MKPKKTQDATSRKEPSPHGEGLNKTERSILSESTKRHDKALRILSKL